MSKIAIVGVEGSGKTVLMAALGDMYGQMSTDSLYLMPENQAAFAFMTRIPHKMRVERQWPEATAIESMKFLRWTVRVGAEVIAELEMLDYPGELYRLAFGDRKEDEIEGTKAQIHEFLDHLVTADDLIVLFNLKDAMDIGSNARNNETVWLTRGIFDYAKKLPNIKRQLLMFTQADRYSKLLEEVGGAKAAQMKYLPMLSVLHPDLECAAVSSVEASETNTPDICSDNRGLSCLMQRIVMSTEIGQLAMKSFEKYKQSCDLALRAYKTREELNGSIQQLRGMLAGIGSMGTVLIEAFNSGAVSSCAGQVQLLVRLLADIDAVISANSENDLGIEQPWQPLLEQYSDRPEFIATIRNLMNEYNALTQRKELARLAKIRNTKIDRILGNTVMAFLVIALGTSAWYITCEFRINQLAIQTGLPRAVCSSALWRNADAQYQVGSHFLTACPGRDLVQAVEWLKKAATKGNPEAQDALCRLYYHSSEYMTDMPKDASTAKCFTKQAKNGQPWAQYVLGEMYFAGLGVAKDEAGALRLWMESAENGNQYGMMNVGNAKYRGDGGTTNFIEASKWCLKAAEIGFPEAQLSLGLMFANGLGVARDDVEAVKWFQRAADQGYGDAQLCLGLAYANGIGVAKDNVEAAKWLGKAADQGVAAMKWFKKAADQGEAYAQICLGTMYAGGRGEARDDEGAVKWFRKAADQGDAKAQTWLGVMFAEGRGVAKDAVEAMKWFRLAAAQKNAMAQYKLGEMYENGRGPRWDCVQALQWYKEAAANNYPNASNACDRVGKLVRELENELLSKVAEQIEEAKRKTSGTTAP